jgi:hypothetical protein
MRIAEIVFTRGLRQRLGQQQGQTATEYLGILVVVALIIGALAASGISDDIANQVRDLVQSVGEGEGARTVTGQ